MMSRQSSMQPIACAHCGREFLPKRSSARYCSKDCGAFAGGQGRRLTATPLEDRFWSKVDCSGGKDACWPWKAHVGSHGYGIIARSHSDHTTAPRVAWELTYSP